MLKGSTLTSSVLASMGVFAISFIGIILVWLFVDRVGRKRLQAWGFLGLGVIFIFMGLIPRPSFPIFLGLFLLLSIVDQGPGQLTYVFPTEVFPTAVRASGHGFATASSRLGALLGILVLPIFVASVGLSAALIVFGVCDLLGWVITLWLAPEPKGQALLQN